jgi:transcriptional regulator with XRE-family HTH domain
MKAKNLRKKLLENSPAFREEYFKRDIPLEISHMIILERVKRGLTQSDLARLVGTQQSGIARTEKGLTYPDIDFLDRIAHALDMHLSIELKESTTYTTQWEEPVRSPYFSFSEKSFANNAENKIVSNTLPDQQK